MTQPLRIRIVGWVDDERVGDQRRSPQELTKQELRVQQRQAALFFFGDEPMLLFLHACVSSAFGMRISPTGRLTHALSLGNQFGCLVIETTG